MNLATRWLPHLILALAALHLGVGLGLETPLREITDAGVVDSIEGYPERESAFWYLVAGAFLLTLGELARWTVRVAGRLPMRLGGLLTGIGVLGIVLMPVSGFWVVALLGVVAMRAAREPASGGREAPARAPAPS